MLRARAAPLGFGVVALAVTVVYVAVSFYTDVYQEAIPPPRTVPTDCVAGRWTPWAGACPGGAVRRTRAVTTAPQFGGRPCGASEEERPCPSPEPPPPSPPLTAGLAEQANGAHREGVALGEQKVQPQRTQLERSVPGRERPSRGETKEAKAKTPAAVVEGEGLAGLAEQANSDDREGVALGEQKVQPKRTQLERSAPGRERPSRGETKEAKAKTPAAAVEGEGLTVLQRLGIQPILASMDGWPDSESFRVTEAELQHRHVVTPNPNREDSIQKGLALFSGEMLQKWKQWLTFPDKLPDPQLKQKWERFPRIQLLVRCHTGGAPKLLTILLESLEWYWPAEYARLVIVLDDEAPRDHVFGDFLTHVHPYPEVAFQPDPGDLFPSKICGRSKGYDRQMWSGFYADLYSEEDIIAIVDDDCLFVTPVTPEDLFEDGLPRVIGKQTVWMEAEGKYLLKGVDNGRWAYTTERLLRLRQAADFMWNFPVLIRRSTFVGCRRWIAHVHNSTFNEAFAKMAGGLGRGESYCQINIILNYAWYFQRDKYKWHLQSVPGSPYQNGTYNTPHVRLGTHARGLTQEKIYNYVIEGYCYACLHLQNCNNTQATKLHHSKRTLHQPVLHNWDHTGILWTEKALGGLGSPGRAQEDHYARVRRLPARWPPAINALLRRTPDYFTDCSKPPDDRNCTQDHAHRHDQFQRVRASRSKHEREFLEVCRQLIGLA